MSLPLISVVIPTLRRPDTLHFALQTLVAQDYQYCEFIVQNNGHDPAIEAVVRSCGDERICHFATPEVLPMTDNWEVGLSNARGDIVTFIGDDDGLMPDACSIAAAFFEKHDNDLLSWAPYWYFWSAYFHPGFRNRLLANVDFNFFAEEVSSRRELSRVFSYRSTYDRLPMIYNSFVHRRVLDRARGRLGRYFLGISPDITSGIVNAAISESFMRLSRPLSVTGTSQHSTGHTINYSGNRLSHSASMIRDFHPFEEDRRLPPNNLLQVLIARDLLSIQGRMFPNDRSIVFNYRGLMQAIGDTINDHPGYYDELVEAIKFIGSAHGIDSVEITIPPRTDTRLIPKLGADVIGNGVVRFVMDGAVIGLRSIADAVRLMAQIAPRASALVDQVRKDAEPAMAVLRDQNSLEFTSAGNGRSALFDGWGEPEIWGTWSLGKRSVLRFKIEGIAAPLDLRVECTPFLHALHPKIKVSCRIGNRRVPWCFAIDQEPWSPSVRIGPEDMDADGMLTIILEIANPVSPATLNAGNDTRALGIGLKAISYSAGA
jgi:glycosyltransferase involved in cell wall biosynthesis